MALKPVIALKVIKRLASPGKPATATTPEVKPKFQTISPGTRMTPKDEDEDRALRAGPSPAVRDMEEAIDGPIARGPIESAAPVRGAGGRGGRRGGPDAGDTGGNGGDDSGGQI